MEGRRLRVLRFFRVRGKGETGRRGNLLGLV